MNTFFFDDVQYPEGLFGGKDFFNPIIYSTEEREVGVWTDNKPLYQKTWILNNEILLNSNGVTINEIDASMVEHLVSCYGNYQPLSNTKSIPVLVWKYNNTWYYGSSMSAYVDTITLLYTKTTDVAGSGEYNTLGIPNVHYDGNEKVVGTWFGETLYEKTMEIVNSTKGSVTIDLTGMNISRVVKKEGIWDRTNNQDTYWMDFGVYINSEIYSYLSDDIGHNRLYMARFASSNETLTKAYITIRYTKTS